MAFHLTLDRRFPALYARAGGRLPLLQFHEVRRHLLAAVGWARELSPALHEGRTVSKSSLEHRHLHHFVRAAAYHPGAAHRHAPERGEEGERDLPDRLLSSFDHSSRGDRL